MGIPLAWVSGSVSISIQRCRLRHSDASGASWVEMVLGVAGVAVPSAPGALFPLNQLDLSHSSSIGIDLNHHTQIFIQCSAPPAIHLLLLLLLLLFESNRWTGTNHKKLRND